MPSQKRPPQDAGYDPRSGDADSGGTASSIEKEEYIQVVLADIRKEVQCPICLGIIRKTRTVMECLHRFCRECIDKSMRLGNNECPACRTHCASRRSLRDDPNYDALIAALYPDIDGYEEEELTFHEEDNNRNKKIQALIAETCRKQTEALSKRRYSSKVTTAAFIKKPGYRQRGRRRSIVPQMEFHCSEDEEGEGNGNDAGKGFSSEDEPVDTRPKKHQRWPGPRLCPSLEMSCANGGFDGNADMRGRQSRVVSPARATNKEVLVWGKGSVRTRSQTRHGNSSGSGSKTAKLAHAARLVDYLHNLDEDANEFDLHMALLPLDKEKTPCLDQPYISCRSTVSVGQLCQLISLQTSVHAEEIEILVRKPRTLPPITSTSADLSEHPQKLEKQETLSRLHSCFSSSPGNLVLFYRSKIQSNP